MKTSIIIGEDADREEVRVKTYSGGTMVVDSEDSFSEIKGKEKLSEVKTKLSKEEKKEVMKKPNNFEILKSSLVRKNKKQ